MSLGVGGFGAWNPELSAEAEILHTWERFYGKPRRNLEHDDSFDTHRAPLIHPFRKKPKEKTETQTRESWVQKVQFSMQLKPPKNRHVGPLAQPTFGQASRPCVARSLGKRQCQRDRAMA